MCIVYIDESGYGRRIVEYLTGRRGEGSGFWCFQFLRNAVLRITSRDLVIIVLQKLGKSYKN